MLQQGAFRCELQAGQFRASHAYITAVETICSCLGKIASAADHDPAECKAWAVQPTQHCCPLRNLGRERQVPLRCDESSARFVDAEAL